MKHHELIKQTQINVGKRIHQIRAEKQIPIAELAARTGLAVRRIDSYETARIGIKLGAIVIIAKALNVQPSKTIRRLTHLLHFFSQNIFHQ